MESDVREYIPMNPEREGGAVKGVVRYSVAATVLALGMVVSAAFISRFFVRVKHEKEITVKGYAEAGIVSDIGQLSVTVRASDARRDKAYLLLTDHVQKVLTSLRHSAPDDLAVGLGNPHFQEHYRLNDDGNETNEVESYAGTQTVAVASSDVHWIKKVGQGLNAFIGQGYNIQVHAPDFLVSNLDQIKRELLQRATANGYERAQVLANNSGARVGALRAGRQGVFQITEPNSTRTSGYGIYDTSTIHKVIKAVVTLEYSVE